MAANRIIMDVLRGASRRGAVVTDSSQPARRGALTLLSSAWWN